MEKTFMGNMMTEEQELFWNILSHTHPDFKSCDNCLYFSPGVTGACVEPEFIRTSKPNCVTPEDLVKWRWNGK